MTRPNSVGAARQNLEYRTLIAVTGRVAEAALSGADADELTHVFAQQSNKTVVLLDPEFGLRASSTSDGSLGPEWDPDDPVITKMLAALARERRTIRLPALPCVGRTAHGCVATPITVGADLLGFLLVFDDAATDAAGDSDLLIASYAASLFALTLAHERTSTDLGLRYQAVVVDALVSGHYMDLSDARRKASSIGMPSNAPFRVGVLRIDAEQLESTPAGNPPTPRRVLLGEVVATFTLSVPGVVVAIRGGDIVAIVPESDGRADREAGPAPKVMAALADAVRAAGLDDRPTAGVSERTTHPELAPKALQQAEHAIDLGLRLGRTGQVVAYDDLGIYRLLLQIGDMQLLLEFAEGILGPLIDYDATHKVDLIGTLSVYLSQHASLKQAARQMHLHANTISYRMQRIAQLTPLDMTDPEDRLVAHVAVKIIESLRQVRVDGTVGSVRAPRNETHAQ